MVLAAYSVGVFATLAGTVGAYFLRRTPPSRTDPDTGADTDTEQESA